MSRCKTRIPIYVTYTRMVHEASETNKRVRSSLDRVSIHCARDRAAPSRPIRMLYMGHDDDDDVINAHHVVCYRHRHASPAAVLPCCCALWYVSSLMSVHSQTCARVRDRYESTTRSEWFGGVQLLLCRRDLCECLQHQRNPWRKDVYTY